MTPAIKGNYLKQEILESKVLSIVIFESEWNGSCQIVAPILEELAIKYEHTISFYKIDIEEEKEIAYEYGIMELPTIFFFKSGEVIDHIIGLTSKYTIQEKIENILFPSDYSKSFHNQ
jgi:thioredoxin 1